MPDDKLTDYRKKRDPGATPEPEGGELGAAAAGTRAGAFVVHLHDATRRHYDLRIETAGVLASFAVPKGPALDPNDKQLAVRTEDHPIEYLDFEAVIPEGQYGAGPMICWDRGGIRYLESTVEEGLASGKIDFTLQGYKLRGRFALVKLAKSGVRGAENRGNEWLLIKKADAHATTDDPRVLQPRSVLSGLTVEELERAPAMMAEAEALAKGLGAKLGEVDGRALSPMLCSSLDDSRLRRPAFGGSVDRTATVLPASLERGYTYELKLDGVRVIADKRDGDVRLTYRSNRDTTAAYPEVARAVQTLGPARVVLDGEIVAFDEKGLPNFQRLAQRIHASERTRWAMLGVPVVYLVFDVLALGSYDLRPLPLVCRREILRQIVLGSGVIRALDHLESGGNALLDFCRARHLEGIVAKRADSPYRAGPKRTNDWVKVKCERDESFVVIGFTRGNEGRSRLGALDLGSYEDGGERLVVRGKVGSGLDEKTIDLLLDELGPLVTREKKFAGKLDGAPNGRTLVEPKLVVSVRYLGWSDDGRLRFPTFRGVDYDRSPTDCVASPHGDQAIHLPSLEAPRFKKRRPPESVRGSHPLKRAVLTNQDKVFWPKEGFTKGDLCRYYETISNVLLPYLHDRPVVIVRYPDGIEGKSFFQWNVPWGFPAWIRHYPLGMDEEGRKKRVFLVNDLDSLLAVANLGAIPMHVLACRVGSLECCDFCTVDFDVQRSTLQNGVRLALELRGLLDRIGLRGYPKTSGQHGLHVLVPLGPGVSFETAQALNALLGRLVAARHPDIATLDRVVERRGPRVLVDIGQTGRRRTIVAPYSVRAFPGATVSAPLAWSEVADSLESLEIHAPNGAGAAGPRRQSRARPPRRRARRARGGGRARTHRARGKLRYLGPGMPGLVALQPGAVFARDFRVVRKLSEGGMGAVYVAVQLSTGRERALKLMHPELVGDAALRAKFVQEARIGARIASDHVVEVIAAGVDEETGVPFLAMELLEGEDLEKRIARGVPSRDEAYAILESTCHALAAAHAAGIVHRDVKPENVFLRRARSAGASATVKVLDFGIAKVIEEARTSSNTGAMGSPYWMAPEQTERRATITPATDVWAIGLLAFDLFTGRPFWRSANDEASSLTAFMRELVLEPIPPASQRATDFGVAERLPDGFDAWFARCVSREPSERFADAAEAWRALAAAAGKSTWTIEAPPSAPDPPRARTGEIALARTLPRDADDDPLEEPRGVPVSSAKWPLAIVGVALLGGAGVFAAMHASSGSAAQSVATTATTKPADLICPDGMAALPGGRFAMGSNDGETDERPVHDVQLNAFCIDLSEVTVAQYDACAKEGRCPAALPSVDWPGIQPHDHAVWDDFCNEGKPGREAHPINCVAFEQAHAFCKHQGKRLPSEEEWELAARGTEARPYPWGADAPGPTFLNACGAECAAKGKLLDTGWTPLYSGEDGWSGTAPVRSYPAGRTPTGVFNLAGNVSEWTSSSFCPYPGTNCSSDTRATRGSAWTTEEVRHVRATARSKSSPSSRSADLGFRCAK